VAEQVEKVNPDLVVRDADGKVYSVRYEAEHRKVEEQDATIAQQQKVIAALATQLNRTSGANSKG
jgi:YD repeat-containing protein